MAMFDEMTPAELSPANHAAQREVMKSILGTIKVCRRMLAVHRKEDAEGRCPCWLCTDVRHLIYVMANSENLISGDTFRGDPPVKPVADTVVPAKEEPAPAPAVKFREFL